MVELIDYTIRKARKEHICGYCLGSINKGEEYIRQCCKNEDLGIYTFKAHTKCQELADYLLEENYVELDYLDADEFYTGIKEFLRDWICPKCGNWNKELRECEPEIDSIECIDKILEFSEKYNIIYDNKNMRMKAMEKIE